MRREAEGQRSVRMTRVFFFRSRRAQITFFTFPFREDMDGFFLLSVPRRRSSLPFSRWLKHASSLRCAPLV